MYVPIGFRGGIYDPDTGLVHFHERNSLAPPSISSPKTDRFYTGQQPNSNKFYEGADYDPLIGQWTSPGISDLLNAQVTPFYPYQIIDPVNSHPLYSYMTITSSWLDALGFEINNVVHNPQMTFRKNVSKFLITLLRD